MCQQTTYKLPCEHVHTVTTYCPVAPSVSSSSSSSSKSKSSPSKPSSSKKRDHFHQSSSSSLSSASSPGSKRDHHHRKTCKAVSHITVPYPPPAGFDPRAIPHCPLPSCPYEVRNRCWNCCWCGKGWNVGGRCNCVMVSDGNEFRCDHICCATCEAAS